MKKQTLTEVLKPTIAATYLLPKSIAALIEADYQAAQRTDTARKAEVEAMQAILKALDLNNTAMIQATIAAINTRFGDDKDRANVRTNIIRNAVAVAVGGTVGRGKDKVAVKGKGIATVNQVLSSADTLTELKAELAKAKPEALKPARSEVQKAKSMTAAAPITLDHADEQLVKVIQFYCENVLDVKVKADSVLADMLMKACNKVLAREAAHAKKAA